MTGHDQTPLERLGIARPSRLRRFIKWMTVLLVLTASLGGGVLYFNPEESPSAVRYITDDARVSDIEVTVSATGNLEPIQRVEVSSEQSGRVDAVLVDYNDPVAKGQVLAMLDTTKLQADVLVKRNTLVSARAAVSQARAALKEKQLAHQRVQQLWTLSGGRTPSRIELEAAEVALVRAEADLTVSEAAVAVAQANLEASETDLEKSRIVSPIDGIVLSRQVEPGQTVAASLSAPTLFVLAGDLIEMVLHVDIDEADIGRVNPGQLAQFTVDAYPGRRFKSTIVQIRLISSTQESSNTSVVSYETILSAPNPDRALLPGMTANAEISVASASDVMTIANAALRYRHLPPSANPREAGATHTGGNNLLSFLFPRRPRGARDRGPDGSTSRPAATGDMARIWALRNDQPVPVDVILGLSDGLRTEVVSGELAEGEAVITDRLGPQ